MAGEQDAEHRPIAGKPQRRVGMAWALGGIALTLCGMVAYVFLLRQPLLRSTGLPIWVGGAAGLVGSMLAWRRDSRILVRFLGLANLGLVGFFWFAFFVGSRLPGAPEFAQLEQAPDFTLTGPDGRVVSSHELLDSGPLLLVFYRGAW